MIIKGIIIVLILLFVIYGAAKAGNFLLGPKIAINFPKDGQVFTSPDIEISGQASNISLLYLNGRQIFTDKDGNFKKTINVFPGKTKITIKSVNSFNKTTVLERNIEVKI